MKTIQADVAVIGAGTAGLAAYRAAKAEGARTVLIEGGPHGTTCARVGCMPSKLLIAAADAAHNVMQAAHFGVHASGMCIDGQEVMTRVKRERDRFVGFVVGNVEAMPDEDRLSGYARFIEDNLLQVGDEAQVHAAAVVIATGSTPILPDVLQGLGDRLVVNDDVFEWNTLPKSVAVIGSGVIGLELGEALARLGVKVSVFGARGHLGPLTDPAIIADAQNLLAEEFHLERQGRVISAIRIGSGVLLRYQREDGSLHEGCYEYVLVASGRRPNLSQLGLENTSFDIDAKGVPRFDAQTLQVGAQLVFIAGDVNGTLQILHEAADEGRIAGRNAARVAKHDMTTPLVRRAPLAIVFTDPQMALVGRRHSELPDGSFVVGEVSFVNQGRSRVMLKNRGRLHVYVEKHSGRLLGAEIIGPAAEHLGHLLAWSLQMNLTIDAMLAMPFYHPVVEEGVRTALRDAAEKLLHSAESSLIGIAQ